MQRPSVARVEHVQKAAQARGLFRVHVTMVCNSGLYCSKEAQPEVALQPRRRHLTCCLCTPARLCSNVHYPQKGVGSLGGFMRYFGTKKTTSQNSGQVVPETAVCIAEISDDAVQTLVDDWQLR